MKKKLHIATGKSWLQNVDHKPLGEVILLEEANKTKATKKIFVQHKEQ